MLSNFSKLLFLSNYVYINKNVENTTRKKEKEKKVSQNLFVCSEM